MPRTRGPHLLSWPTDVCRPLSSPPLTNAPSDGPAVISWIEHHCVYGEGDHWGEPVRLEVFEKLFLIWLFERRPDGRRRYRRALLEVPKGNGKTSLAAWIGAYMLATQHSAVIPVAAGSFEQAGLLFDDLRTTVAESPTLSRVMVAYENEIQLVDGPGRAYRVAAIAGTNDGQRPSTFLATLALEQETYRARDEPLPVRISRTEEIAAPRYDDGQGVDTSEALGDEVRARLGHIVRTNSEERHIFRIGEDGLLSGGIATAEQRRLPSPHDGR
jgi:hypothetical protein